MSSRSHYLVHLLFIILILDQGYDVVHGLECHDVVGGTDHHAGQVIVIVIILGYQSVKTHVRH